MKTKIESEYPHDLAHEILQKTNDGNDLAPQHLSLLQGAVNGNLTEKGIEAFKKLHKEVLAGYTKPWYHGIKNMTQDHEGFIYWRGIEVEHYSHDSYESAEKSAKELERRCKILESKGIKPTSSTAIWKWKEYGGN